MYLHRMTTVEDVQSMAAGYERAVADSAAQIAAEAPTVALWDTGRLARLVNNHAEAVGAARAAADFAGHFKEGEDAKFAGSAAQGVKALTRRLLRGADDTWSGRSNDAARAEFDGYRKMAESIMEAL